MNALQFVLMKAFTSNKFYFIDKVVYNTTCLIEKELYNVT